MNFTRKTHRLKLLEEFADFILHGDKKFEIRINDRGYQRGDYVEFEVIDGHATHVSHPLDEKKYEITYVSAGYGLKDGYVVFGIRSV